MEYTKGFFLELNRGKVELVVKVDLRNTTFWVIFMRKLQLFGI